MNGVWWRCEMQSGTAWMPGCLQNPQNVCASTCRGAPLAGGRSPALCSVGQQLSANKAGINYDVKRLFIHLTLRMRTGQVRAYRWSNFIHKVNSVLNTYCTWLSSIKLCLPVKCPRFCLRLSERWHAFSECVGTVKFVYKQLVIAHLFFKISHKHGGRQH